MSTLKVLLTGSTGSLGASILSQLLGDSNIVVIAVLRSLVKSETFLKSKYAAEVSSGRLSFIEIPDMTVENSFNAAAEGVDAIIHVATPLAYNDLIETMVKPSLKILHNVLTSAEASGRVKRLIVTGSLVSTCRLPDELFSGRTITASSWNNVTLEEAEKNPVKAYQYSKVYAEKKAWEFMEDKKRTFDLIFLLAPSITGKSIQEGFKPVKGQLGGQANLYRELFDVEKPGFLFPFFMDVEDVAKVHVHALSPSVPGNQRYLFHTGLINGNDMAQAIREDFPQLKDRVPGTEDGSRSIMPPDLITIDNGNFNKIFGTEWKTARQSTKETVEDILAYEDPTKV